MISKRLKYFDSSKVRMAFQMAEEMRNPIDLSIGYPSKSTPMHIKAAGIEAIRGNRTRYTPSNGTPALRKAIARKLNRENKIKATDNSVTVVPGLTTGILLTFLALLDPGDEILVPDPYFPPYRDLAIMLGAKPVFVNTYPEFQLTASQLKAKITKKTKVIMINSPNNPTGAVYPENELRAIAKLAKQHDLVIISDEIYEYFVNNGDHFSIGSIYPRTITMNGFSKAYSMTGWRVGYIHGPQEIIDAINELLQYTVFSTSSIAQHAALAALKRKPSRITNEYRKKRDLTKKILVQNFLVNGCQGAYYAFVKLPGGVSDMDFTTKAKHRGVIILPGSAFSKRQDYIRITYTALNRSLQTGLDIICELAESPNKVFRKSPKTRPLISLSS